jgi:hypothetical protein
MRRQTERLFVSRSKCLTWAGEPNLYPGDGIKGWLQSGVYIPALDLNAPSRGEDVLLRCEK